MGNKKHLVNINKGLYHTLSHYSYLLKYKDIGELVGESLTWFTTFLKIAAATSKGKITIEMHVSETNLYYKWDFTQIRDRMK